MSRGLRAWLPVTSSLPPLVAAALLLLGAACGRVGPPVRSRPAPAPVEAPAATAPSPATPQQGAAEPDSEEKIP